MIYTSTSHLRAAALLMLLLTSGASADLAQSTKAVSVPCVRDRITIDGALTEPAWKSAGVTSSFVHYKGDGSIANPTTVKLLYDSQAVYVAFECAEKDVAGIKSRIRDHDGSVWDDDVVEMFLDCRGDRASFMQFDVNSIGTKYDALGSDAYGYNPSWQAAAKVGKSGWTVEIRIPFSELGASPPKPGDSWLGNFCREEQPSSELSCWRLTNGSFASTASFGEIIFGGFADKAARDIAKAEADLGAVKDTSRAVKVDVSGLLDDATSLVSQAKRVEPVSEQAYLRCQELIRDARDLLDKANRVVRRAKMGNPDYLVWETTPWKHFSAKEDSSGVRQDSLSVQALVLAGQTESKALMVSNLTDETLSARLLLSGFPKDSVEILVPTFVRCADGSAYPDALVPTDPIGQITVPPGETRQIWVNVRSTNPGKFDGTITISPLTASKTDKQVKFSVEVIRPPKPVPEPLAFTWDYLGDAAERGLEERYVQSMVDHGIRVFLITGLRYMPRPAADDAGNFLEPTDWSRFEREVRLKWKPGRKLYIGLDVWEKAQERPIYNGKFDSPGWRIAFKRIISEMVGVLRKAGLSYDDYMVNPVDECIDERYIAIARLVKEADPKIKIVEDTVGASLDQVREADKYTDYWIPHLNAFPADGSKASIEYMKSTGKPVGFYFYSEGANEKAQDSYRHYLRDFWFAYSRGLNGVFGYWTATQHYGNPWNRHETKADYDPSLFYYGNGCVITGRRWEAWRRGIEDFALLKLCESAGVDRKVLEEAVRSVLASPDPDVADRARETLIRALAAR